METAVPTGLFDLRGRVAAVTGASSGVGRTLAEALASHGAAVVLIARRRDRLEEAVAAIEAAGARAAYLEADLATREGIARCIQDASRAFGPPEILVNAAGINLRQPASEITDQDWDTTLGINLKVPFMLARGLVPDMKVKGWGRVINVASLQSVRAFPNSIAYGASKGGIVQLTRAMAEEWSRHGIACNAIAPGLFPTEMTESIYRNPERIADYTSRTAIGRPGRLEDLWGITVFLAARGSDYITGQTIFIDGGYTAK